MSLYIGRNPLQQIGKNKDDIAELQQTLDVLQVPQLTSPNHVVYNATNGATIDYDNGTQLKLPIVPGNGVTIDAASDNEHITIKLADTLKIPTDSGFGIYIDDTDNTQFVYFDAVEGTMNLNGSGTTYITIDGASDTSYADSNLGPEITTYGGSAIGSAGDVTQWIEVCPVYKFPSTIPTTASNGTLPNDQSWTYLKTNGARIKLLFNKEYYILADEQHTTGTLVFSHTGYESGQLIVKTITITMATRGWVLTTIKPAVYMAINNTSIYSDSAKTNVVGQLVFNIPCAYSIDIDTYMANVGNISYIQCTGYVTVEGTTYQILYADQYDPETGTIYLYTTHNTNGEAYYISNTTPDYVLLS